MSVKLLSAEEAQAYIAEKYGIENAEVSVHYLQRSAGLSPMEKGILGRYDLVCQPVWKFVKNGKEVYLNVFDARVNRDKKFPRVEEFSVHSGDSFQKGEEILSAVRGWKNDKFSLFFVEGEVKNAIRHVYRG